jgi:flavin reductase (DIM6/NTAB) family NADH-FMN oxidoreductase RutF
MYMDLKYGSPAREPFVTNVGLITSNGKHGHNIMSAEWTYQISYDPGLIAVSIASGKATHENIAESKYFGVCIASVEQTAVSSLAGGSSGKKVNKISALKDMGFTFSDGKHFDLLLVDGSALIMECKLTEQVVRGDHTVFIGEVQSTFHDKDKSPLLYHDGKYWSIGAELPKPTNEERANMKAFVEKHAK